MPTPGPLAPVRSVHVCATRPERSPSLNHLGFGKPLLYRRIRPVEPEQCHLKLPIHPPRGQHGADVQRRLQGRHIKLAVGEAAEIEPVGHAVQCGFNYVWLWECVGELAVTALRGPMDQHHFHLPMAIINTVPATRAPDALRTRKETLCGVRPSKVTIRTP